MSGTAALAQRTELVATVDRLRNTLDTLICAVQTGDLVTASYAAATVAELGDTAQTQLIAMRPDTRPHPTPEMPDVPPGMTGQQTLDLMPWGT